MSWTLFNDMNSGGGRKLKWELIAIEAPREEAEAIFYSRFDRNPNRVTCTCCGPDYSIDESETLEQALGFHMGWAWDDKAQGYVERSTHRGWGSFYSLKEFLALDKAHVIRASEITSAERGARVPRQGYVWID